MVMLKPGKYKALRLNPQALSQEEINKWVEKSMASLREQGATPYVENDCIYTKEGNQHWRIPKLDFKEIEGVLQIRSADTVFTPNNGVEPRYASKPKKEDYINDMEFRVANTSISYRVLEAI